MHEEGLVLDTIELGLGELALLRLELGLGLVVAGLIVGHVHCFRLVEGLLQAGFIWQGA